MDVHKEDGWIVRFTDKSGREREDFIQGTLLNEITPIMQWYRSRHPDWQVVSARHTSQKTENVEITGKFKCLVIVERKI